MPLRFHLDENVDVAVAHALRRRGVDVTLASEVNLITASDDAHLEFARRAERVIVTHDPDFLRLHAGGRPHAGIAFCASGSRSIGQISRRLIHLNLQFTPDQMHNRVEFL
ncbi:MAG TPA: DUF5615 family PIN-like protein [Phycisphaerae bacterium]|jgi:predicted nuclease of predicted toxin-antitoxin system